MKYGEAMTHTEPRPPLDPTEVFTPGTKLTFDL